MKSVTYNSEQARLHWRDLLDAALSGARVIIERYGKPTVVMLSYEEYCALEKRAALSDSPDAIEARNDANNSWVSQEEIDEIFADVHHPV